MKQYISIIVCLFLSGLGIQAQTENYPFFGWAPENSEVEYVSVLATEPAEVSSGATCYVETATFAGNSLNCRFAFASAESVTLSADKGLYVKNNAGKKNTTVAILGLQAGDKVTVEYYTGDEVQITSGNAFYELPDGTTKNFTTIGKNNANKLSSNTNGANGGSEYTFTITQDGSLDFLSAKTEGSIRFWNVVVHRPSERRAAFVFNSTYPEFDSANNRDLLDYVQQNSDALKGIEICDIDLANTTVEATTLRDYELVILSSAINANEPQAEALRQTIGYVPMLNMSTNLYETWGYGTPTNANTNMVAVTNKNHELFAILNLESDTLEYLAEGGEIKGYTNPSEYFGNDQVLATVGDVNVVHVHNAGRNTYMLLPIAQEMTEFLSYSILDILPNAINILKSSARTIVKTATPEFQLNYEDRLTTVTLTCPTTGALTWFYYTTDGTEPTEQSQRYTEPIQITEEGCIVKAIARTDGYEMSETLTTDVIEIRSQVETPNISIAKEEEGMVTIEMTCPTPNATIYYNYTGSNLLVESAPYTGPITLTSHATLTALAAAEGMVNSETTNLFVKVKGERVRIDTLAWMNSHDEAYGSGDLVKQYSYWSKEVVDSIGTPVTNADGTPVLDENNEPLVEWTYIYAPADSLTYRDFGNGWAIGSYGQRINNQVNNGTGNIGTGEYGPATVNDWGFSRAAMSFLVVKDTGDPATAWIQTTQKHQAPFDIVIWMTGQQAEGLNNEVELSVSADSLTWVVVDTVNTIYLKNVEKFVRSYEGNEEVYFKARSVNRDNTRQQKTLIFDIMLMNHGILSEAFENEGNSVDELLAKPQGRIVRTDIYNLNGMQIRKLGRGINIVRDTYENGTRTTRKVIVK